MPHAIARHHRHRGCGRRLVSDLKNTAMGSLMFLMLSFAWMRAIVVDAREITYRLIFQKSLPSLSPEEGYELYLKTWREDNMGLYPPFPYGFVLNEGHVETGVDLTVMWVPPFGLKEGHQTFERTAKTLQATYKVLNPGWLTWPVSDHEGQITFFGNHLGGSEMEWTVEWTPWTLPSIFNFLQSSMNQGMEDFVASTIEVAVNHIASADPLLS